MRKIALLDAQGRIVNIIVVLEGVAYTPPEGLTARPATDADRIYFPEEELEL